MSYATDGKCHNAQPGTYGHECGKPATWIGGNRAGFCSGFCGECKRHGYEAQDVVNWERPTAESQKQLPEKLPDLHAQITEVSATLSRNSDHEGMEP